MTNASEVVSQLKPCPFCGGEPEIHHHANAMTVRCLNEECLVQPNTGGCSGDKSIAAWNTRPAPRVGDDVRIATIRESIRQIFKDPMCIGDVLKIPESMRSDIWRMVDEEFDAPPAGEMK